jgi:hypothetical protein
MPNENQSQLPKNMRMKKKLWPILVATFILVALIGAWFIWNNYLSPAAQRRLELERNYEKATSAMKTFEDAMRADTYGGKTPEETLSMLIDALKKGDIKLAAKYFTLDTKINNPDYLTRNKWEKGLEEKNSTGEIENLIGLLEKAQPAGSSMVGYFGFEIRESTGELMGDVGMQLNRYSNTWKIESM